VELEQQEITVKRFVPAGSDTEMAATTRSGDEGGSRADGHDSRGIPRESALGEVPQSKRHFIQPKKERSRGLSRSRLAGLPPGNPTGRVKVPTSAGVAGQTMDSEPDASVKRKFRSQEKK